MRCAPRLGPRGHQRRGGRDRRRPIVRQGGRCPTRAMLRSRVSQMSRDAGASVVTACPRVRTGTTEQAPTRRSVLSGLAAWAGVFPKPRRWSEADPAAAIDVDRGPRGLNDGGRGPPATAGLGSSLGGLRLADRCGAYRISRRTSSVGRGCEALPLRPRWERRGDSLLLTLLRTDGLSGSSVSRRTKWTVSTTAPFTWLILPVVICLSQRLSHASVSTCRQMAKPRTAH